MGLTNFPNGITTRTSSAQNANAGDNDFNCLDAWIDGTLTVGTVAMGVQGSAGVGFVGQRVSITGSFTSAASTSYFAVPFAGNIVDAVTISDTTPRTSSAFTVRAGSAGSVAVASVALVFATAIGQQVRPALTPVAVTTASGISVVVTTAGSAANFGFTLIIEKTA